MRNTMGQIHLAPPNGRQIDTTLYTLTAGFAGGQVRVSAEDDCFLI
jgi:hypothetical protein